jgi:hypothetical protein
MKKDVIITKKFNGTDWLRIAILSIIGIAFIIFSAISMKYFIETPRIERVSQTGTVISKSQDEVTIKYGTKTELYLNIQFDNVGFKSIEVEPTTYFGSDVGERVSFGLIKEKNGLEMAKFLWGFVLTAIAIIALILISIKWLFDFEMEK